MALADVFIKRVISHFLMEISLESLSWESSTLKRTSRKKSLVARRGFTDFSVRADCYISEKLTLEREHFRKQRVLSAALPQSLGAHPCSLCIPALHTSSVQVYPKMPFLWKAFMEALLPLGVYKCSWSKGWSRRLYLDITFIVRCWESKIPAALKLLGFFVWEYFMHSYLKVHSEVSGIFLVSFVC